jgi:hypothetical protein
VDKNRHSTPTSKPHPNFKVWWREHFGLGCFAATGPGQIAIIDGKMNSHVYQDILQENVMLSVRQLKLDRSWAMQQDNDPKHSSKSTTERH